MSLILLIEDDAVLRGGLTELFTREGYNVISAISAKEAHEMLSSSVNLIVLDVGLPDGDGVSLCQQWRLKLCTRLCRKIRLYCPIFAGMTGMPGVHWETSGTAPNQSVYSARYPRTELREAPVRSIQNRSQHPIG